MELYELYYYLEFYNIHGYITGYQIDDIWDMVNKRYSEINNIKLDKNVNKDKVYLWLKEKTRLLLLNELISKIIFRLSNYEKIDDIDLNNMDTFFLNNISLISYIVNEEEDYILNNINRDICKIPEMSKKEVTEIVSDILLEIDDNGEWLDIYKEAIKSKHIIYLNEISKTELDRLKQGLGLVGLDDIENTCLFLGDKDRYLFLNYKGDISDIILTIHEIIHYINGCVDNGKEVAPIIREFPSIFYEMYSLKYIERQGFNQTLIHTINYNRLLATYNAINESSDIIDYLETYIGNGEIKDIYDYEKCDKCISDLIEDPFVLFKRYPYIVGTYLARLAMDKLDDDKMLLPIMKYITENLSKSKIDDIFKLWGVNNKKIKKREIVR